MGEISIFVHNFCTTSSIGTFLDKVEWCMNTTSCHRQEIQEFLLVQMAKSAFDIITFELQMGKLQPRLQNTSTKPV